MRNLIILLLCISSLSVPLSVPLSVAAEEPEFYSRTSLRPINPEPTEDEFQFFEGYGFDINPLAHPGLHTSTLLSDFSLTEIHSRRGKYERFLNDLRVAVHKNLNSRSNPYFYKLLDFWEYQKVVAQSLTWKLKGIYLATTSAAIIASGYAAFTGNFPDSSIFVFPGVASFHALLTALVYFPTRGRADRADKELNAMIDEVNAANFESKKVMMFAYDLVEAMAATQIQFHPQDNPEAYYQKFLKMLESFPLAFPGFVLRAEAGIGVAGQLRAIYEADRLNRSPFWQQKLDEAPNYHKNAKDTLGRGVIVLLKCELDLE